MRFPARVLGRPALPGALLARLFRRRDVAAPWDAKAPVRGDLFGIERLEQHAQTLAAAQAITPTLPSVLPLRARLDDNAAVLLAAYRASASELESGRGVVPAAEWLLDNYHLVEEQIREIRDDLPPRYYRQLPKLANGPFAGYPRVFGLAWAFVAHTDSNLDPEMLRRFIAAYQRVQPLTIGELWAVAITLRIVLIENLRRLADQISVERAAGAEADALADRLLAARRSRRRRRKQPTRACRRLHHPASSRHTWRSACGATIRGRHRPSAGWKSSCRARAPRSRTWSRTSSRGRAHRTSPCATSSPACG